MTLAEILRDVTIEKSGGGLSGEIRGIAYDSRRVGKGDLFFALRGAASDGHRFIPQAVAQGAAAVVLEDESQAPEGIPWVRTSDARLALALAAAAFHGDPTAKLPLVGITGTNGKTTTTYLVEGMLEAAGLPTAVLGTVSYRLRDAAIDAPHTTPESADLQRILREFSAMGAKAVVMEVSSHALEQHRVDGCRFDVGVFTNLTPEHLDYHGDMASYRESKKRLFREHLVPDGVKPARRSVINLDDPSGSDLAAASAAPVIGYGLGEGCCVTVRDPRIDAGGISGTLVTPVGEIPFVSAMLGRFNLYNILAAAGTGVALNLPPEAIREGIQRHRKVPGRMERVENRRGVTLLVDYAHTGDALENVLKTVQEIAPRRIITLFGCGGDRDRTKRPVMGRIAVGYSDLAIVTSDNPRTEDPAAIVAEILAGIAPTGIREYRQDELTDGFAGKGFTVVLSRRDAIRQAVRLAGPGDVVVLAGKGHEDYQIVGTVKHHFDDREEAAAAFRELER